MANEELDIQAVLNRLMSDPGIAETVKNLSAGMGGEGASKNADKAEADKGADTSAELEKALPDVIRLLSPMLKAAEKSKSGGSDAEKRNKLLSALKPYLNSNRQEMIDRVMSLSDLTRLAELLPKNNHQ